MKLGFWVIVAASIWTTSATARKQSDQIEPGIYTNEEEVYFDALAKRPTAPWLSLKIDTAGGLKASGVDPFQRPDGKEYRTSQVTSAGPDWIKVTLGDGKTTELRRARAVSCWVAIRKDKPKADGDEDWHFQSGVTLHDQGGRAIIGGGDTGAQQVMIRVRNVTWDKGSTNAPVVALYVHKPDNWDHAESYSWAAPDSARVGINLRWMQSGCAIQGSGKPSKLDARKFRSNEEAKAK